MNIATMWTRFRKDAGFVALVFLGLSTVCFLSCKQRDGHNPTDEGEQTPKAWKFNDDYKAVIDRAERSTQFDELSKLAANVREVTLQQSPIHSIGRVLFGPPGRVAVLDHKTKTIQIFDAEGRYVGPLGENGRGPGKYLTPMSFTLAGNEYATVDFTDHRVNLFDGTSHFDRSFVYTMQKFSSSAILYDGKVRKFYLFGNRYPDDATATDRPNLLHVYDENGTFLHSGFSFPIKWMPYRLQTYDYVLAASDDDGGDYFMLPFEPVLHHILPADSSTQDISLDLPGFKTPRTPLPESLNDLNNFHTWELEFTPVRAIAVHDGFAFVEYETDRDLRYTIAVVRLGKKAPVRTVKTNGLIVGSGNDGSVALINNPGNNRGGANDIVFGHFLE